MDYETEIRNMLQLLSQTDYVALKCAEDETMKIKYADKLLLRKSWRERINEMEKIQNADNTKG